MKRKMIPTFIMLLAGAVASIVMYTNRYEIKSMLWILVAVLIVFYIIGLVIKKVMDSFERAEENTDTVSDEGEVIEKEPMEDASESQDTKAEEG